MYYKKSSWCFKSIALQKKTIVCPSTAAVAAQRGSGFQVLVGGIFLQDDNILTQ
jgi:hypothetical protein